jgi:hypothetical protein
MKKQTQFKPNLTKGPKMRAFAWIIYAIGRSFTMKYCGFLADFTTLKGANSNPIKPNWSEAQVLSKVKGQSFINNHSKKPPLPLVLLRMVSFLSYRTSYLMKPANAAAKNTTLNKKSIPQ